MKEPTFDTYILHERPFTWLSHLLTTKSGNFSSTVDSLPIVILPLKTTVIMLKHRVKYNSCRDYVIWTTTK